MDATDMLKRNVHYLAAAMLLWLLFAQTVRGAVISSITFDEGPHLAVGYATLRTGDFRLQPVHIHPPLANVLAAAPLLLDPSLPDPRLIPGWDIASLSAVTDAVVWRHSPPDGMALAGRLPIILLAILLGAFVYRWASDLAGHTAGLLALFLCALDPNIVAHAQVITTDMGVVTFGFIALYSCYKFQISNTCTARRRKCHKSQKWWLAVTGVALGAALAAKVTAALLAPLIVVIVLLAGRDAIARRVERIVVIGLIAFVVVWAAYGFEIGRVPGLPVPIPAATHVKIYQSLQQHYDEGHPSFLMGMNSTRGWWYYFPVAFLVKTPLPTLILALVSIVLAVGYGVSGIRGGKPASHKSQVAAWTLGLFPAVHFVTALWSSVDIGYRHLLPILPFLFVFIGIQISNLKHLHCAQAQVSQISNHPVTLSPYHLVTLSVILLLAWYAVGAATIFPHNLAYFNELAGGPENGYNWLVDSNLDWGQNLKELKAWLAERARGISRVYLSQFSPARPDVYGLEVTQLPPSPRAAPFARFNPAPGWYAIGATTLQGVYTPDVNTFAYFRAMTPAARIGHALFVYHVAESQGQWVAQCASPTAPLDADEIKASFGRDDLRLVQFDCSTSWWYPANDAPGWYILSPHSELPPGATLEAHARQPDGRPLYDIYKIGRTLAPPLHTDGNMADGPLTFLGFQVNRTSAHPGESVELWTFWRVKQTPNHPLSLMAHLVKPDGAPIAVGDGLGVPIEQWQPGDVIIQRHQLKVPNGTLNGNYSIQAGVYWLDTLQRLPTVDENGAPSDRLILKSVDVLN
jgi:hypothetical protein